jgi:RNA polymerase sigma-70 factor (ECF subfamily)
LTDAELITRLKAKDEQAYREALARYGDALYGYVFTIVRNHHLCEDIVAETYLRLVERIDEYIYTGVPLKAWLFRVAHNLALNSLRRSNQTQTLGDTEAFIPAPDDPAAAAVGRLEAEELRDAIVQLTEDQQQVVLMRFVGGHTTNEVAQALEKSETAVKQLQLRALRALGRLMGGGR